MSVISIQAQVAPHLVENPSDELKENLAGIRQNAVEALTELRRVLGVLRSEDALLDGPATHTLRSPPSTAWTNCVDNVRGAGLDGHHRDRRRRRARCRRASSCRRTGSSRRR